MRVLQFFWPRPVPRKKLLFSARDKVRGLARRVQVHKGGKLNETSRNCNDRWQSTRGKAYIIYRDRIKARVRAFFVNRHWCCTKGETFSTGKLSDALFAN